MIQRCNRRDCSNRNFDASVCQEETIFLDKEYFRLCCCSLDNKTFCRTGKLHVETSCKPFQSSGGDRKSGGSGDIYQRSPLVAEPLRASTHNHLTLEWSSFFSVSLSKSIQWLQLNPIQRSYTVKLTNKTHRLVKNFYSP